ncbi:MAG: hypothetical protein HQ582_24145 [Planctomycetes bacterium]|nr:hypothetical protein [Planctomycetota bacterium]
MDFDPYGQWLNVPPDRRPPTYYDLLGLSAGETDEQRVHEAAQDRYDHVRKYTLGPASPQREQAFHVLVELSEALHCLTDAGRRQDYDRRLRGDEEAAVAQAEDQYDPAPSLGALLDEELDPWERLAVEAGLGTSSECPRCNASLIPGAVLCVRCGMDLRTGQKLTTAVGPQDEAPAMGNLFQAALEHLRDMVKRRARRRRSRDPDRLDVGRQVSSAVGVLIALGVMLVCLAVLIPVVLRFVALSRMDGIVRDLQFTMNKTYDSGKPAVGVRGNIPVAAGKFAQYIRYTPAYLKKVERQEGRAATQKRALVRDVILALPKGTDLAPLRKVSSNSFAYDAAQAALAREGLPDE